MEATDLRELMLSAKNGDRDAFGLLYKHYFVPIFRYIYFKVKNKEVAEDLTQTVFLKVYQAITDFEEQEAPPISYFLTVAKNTVIDYWRKKKEILPDDPEAVFANIKDEKTDPMSDIIREETAKAVMDALGSLNEDQQDVIILKFIEDLSIREVAHLLNKREDAVRQLQCRALRVLRQAFKDSKII